MLRKPSPVLIGAFVTGAILLLVGGLVFFGSGLLFSHSQTFVMFFDSSLKGLDVGSPVTFRGVPIGQVKKIKILVDPETGGFKMPVYISINPRSLFSFSAKGGISELSNQAMKDIIARRGLKAQLQVQSLVTGKLLVDLDFYPNAPVHYIGLDKTHVEIPTVPSTVENIIKTFQEMRIDKLVARVTSVMDGLDALLKSGRIDATLESINDTIMQLQHDMKALTPSLLATLRDVRHTSQAARNLSGSADQRLKALAKDLHRLSVSLDGLVARLNGIAGQVESMTAPGSRERYEFEKTMDEMGKAARSLRVFLDSIAAQPDLIIKGRKQEDGQER